jgi:TolA-binding protein
MVRSTGTIGLALALLLRLASAQTLPAPTSPNSKPAANPSTANSNPPAKAAPPPQTATDQLTQANRDLLELLKKQQSVLEDIQYDRRLQNRQIQNLEERLTTALQQNAQLQAKIDQLKSAPPVAAPPSALPPPAPIAETIPPPPSTYLPPPESEGAPGTKSWHRLFTLSGTDAKSTDLFHVEGPQWRVIWHNQDKPGDTYKNTSALFISAYPKDDTIPQKVCSKLGSGGDATELVGPGNYYLKVEASGGNWELAVEDFK